MFISMTCSFQLAFSADATTCYRRADLCQEQGMLHKHPKGWFRLSGALQPRAFAHRGELLYEVDTDIQRAFAIRFLTWMSQIALARLEKEEFVFCDRFLDSQGRYIRRGHTYTRKSDPKDLSIP